MEAHATLHPPATGWPSPEGTVRNVPTLVPSLGAGTRSWPACRDPRSCCHWPPLVPAPCGLTLTAVKLDGAPFCSVIWPAINQRRAERHRRQTQGESCAKRVKTVPSTLTHASLSLLVLPANRKSSLLVHQPPYFCVFVLTSLVCGPFAPSLHSLDLITLIALFVFLCRQPVANAAVDTRLTRTATVRMCVACACCCSSTLPPKKFPPDQTIRDLPPFPLLPTHTTGERVRNPIALRCPCASSSSRPVAERHLVCACLPSRTYTLQHTPPSHPNPTNPLSPLPPISCALLHCQVPSSSSRPPPHNDVPICSSRPFLNLWDLATNPILLFSFTPNRPRAFFPPSRPPSFIGIQTS
jgi:hypothetical protein